MDITILAAWGEFLGGLAVVVSLVYLASQIRQNTKSARSSAYAAYIASNAAVHESHMQAADVLPAYLNGRADEWNFDSIDYMKFHGHATQVFYNVELAFLLHRDGTIDQEYFESRMRLLKRALELPGLRRFWTEHGGYFYDARFFAYGNSLIDRAASQE